MTINTEFDMGTKATINPVYKSLLNRKDRAKTLEEKLEIHKEILKTPSKLNIDPNFKKLEYVRYADD